MRLQLMKLFFGLFLLFIIYVSYMLQRWRALNEILTLGRIFYANKSDYISMSSPLILTWTTFFSQPWADVIKKNIGNCSYHCIFTNDKKELPGATAILFHIRDLERTLPEIRDPTQLFVFVLHESPLYTFHHLDYVPEDYFNVTMTYRHDSDIYIPYGMMKSITKNTPQEQVWNWSEVVKIASSKRRLVLQMVSNCQTKSKRELYVEQLRAYINVTQHGRCNNSSCDEKCELQEAAQHRFCLAFENSICRDYVTEKLFKCLVQLLVPVVLEKSNYESILPAGSFIAADDFGSPRELAEYLSYLLNNNTAYLSYLKWTKHYEKTFEVNHYCELCKYLHYDVVRPRRIPNIKKWWFQGCIQNYAMTLLGMNRTTANNLY